MTQITQIPQMGKGAGAALDEMSAPAPGGSKKSAPRAQIFRDSRAEDTDGWRGCGLARISGNERFKEWAFI
jgi:hypothetical protein